MLDLPPELAWQAEDYGVHLCFGSDGEAKGGQRAGSIAGDRTYSYEEARYLSVLCRASPAEHARENHCIVPLAGLFARPAGDTAPTLWHDFWRQHKVEDGGTWFQSYIV